MSLDLSNPAHVEALRWACRALLGPLPCAAGLYRSEAKRRAPSPAHTHALDVLATPTRAADLLRRLLERCGVEVEGFVHGWGRKPVQVYDYGNDRIHYVEHNQPYAPDVFRTTWPHQWPRIVLALLDATDRDAALAVLRGTS